MSRPTIVCRKLWLIPRTFINSLKAAGIIAGGRLSFDEAENPKEAILDGKIVFSTKIAFFTPAEWIVDHIEFDPTLISSAVGGNN